MTRQGIDTAANLTTHAKGLRAAGVTFAGRYIGGSRGKDLTGAEHVALRSEGIDVALIYEGDAKYPLGGRARGLIDGAIARDQADALHWPMDRPLLGACDLPLAGSELLTSLRYLEAFVGKTGRPGGAYGSVDLVKAAFDGHLIEFAMQTRGWSRGLWDTRAQIRQVKNGQPVAGVTVDLCVATADDFGQHPRPLAHTAGPVKPAHPTPYHRVIGWRTPPGPDIATVQWCLRGAGYTHVEATGTFDKPTRDAVASYQHGHETAYDADAPCGPGAVKRHLYASLLTYWDRAH